MFNIEDYINYNINHIAVDIKIDKEKISQEARELKQILLNLESLIGPYKVKVANGKIKFKKIGDNE